MTNTQMKAVFSLSKNYGIKIKNDNRWVIFNVHPRDTGEVVLECFSEGYTYPFGFLIGKSGKAQQIFKEPLSGSFLTFND